jgi:hypothetical protein
MIYTVEPTQLNDQVYTIVRDHLHELEPFLDHSLEIDRQVRRVVGWLEDLSCVCRTSPSDCSKQEYQRAANVLTELNEFLHMMNQPLNDRFEQTSVGAIWLQATTWCAAARRSLLHLTREEIWDWIAPSVPDCLEEVGDSVFEAKWAAPVPMRDIEILCRKKGVHIYGDAFEPGNLPRGLAIRFSVFK